MSAWGTGDGGQSIVTVCIKRSVFFIIFLQARFFRLWEPVPFLGKSGAPRPEREKTELIFLCNGFSADASLSHGELQA